MSTMVDMIMDTDALEQQGPFFSANRTDDLLHSGTHALVIDTGQYGVNMPGDSPHGGITYIDQAVGGHQEILEDVMTDYGVGTFSHRQRIQAFQGDYLASVLPIQTTIRGDVGAQTQARGAQRAAMPDMTSLPDRGDVVASFANPALSAMLNRLRGRE
jgi:hypothetical protein